MSASISIRNKTRAEFPRLPFEKMKVVILGRSYDLSLTFIGDTRSQSLHKKYMGKDSPTNILSFPLSKASGEILINLTRAKKEAPRFKMSYTGYVGFLFIHGLLHLEGHRHGSTMTRKEREFVKKFNLS